MEGSLEERCFAASVFDLEWDMRTTLLLFALLPSLSLASDIEARVLDGINSVRHRNRLAILQREARLDDAARSQAVWMANVGRMEHLREFPNSFEEYLRCDHHPANRVVKAGYFRFEELFRIDRNPAGANVVPLPAANDNVGEIIAHGVGGPGAYNVNTVLAGWMNSPGHRGEILQANYREAGVSVCSPAPGVTYWCVVFACR